ncbi:SET domain-containing protein 5 [Diatrype stigma]|uniref:SET domain-containing protein 5 n=1 Tax=Diatrype stigma TaxID=117547 RepID=A0AAN9YRQ4_9PEZI
MGYASDRDDNALADLSYALATVTMDDPEDDAEASYDSDWVAVRRTEHAGMGVFAVRDIPRGTRIAAEAPLIMIPPGADAESATRFCEALLRTPDDALARLDRHHCDPLTLQTVRSTDIGAEILQWTRANLPPASSSRKSPEDIAAQTCKRYAIFLTNNLDTGGAEPEPAPEPMPVAAPGSESEPQDRLRDQVRDRSGGRGLFHLFSRMNHSCAPNVFDHYNTALGDDGGDGKGGGRLTCHAARDIAAGEQLCSHYIDVLVPRRRRQRKLLRGWGFVCDCAACADDALEAARERAIELDDMVEEYVDYYGRDGNGNELVSDSARKGDGKGEGGEGRDRDGEVGVKEGKEEEEEEEAEGEEKPVLTSPGEALEASRELVGLLRRQGLYGLELFNANELGDTAKALEYAGLALDVERCCVGLDATLADDVWGDTGEWIESIKEGKHS